MGSLGEFLGGEEEHVSYLLAPSDPVVVELNRLQNQIKDKDRELGDAHCEIKTSRVSEALKNKAVEELTKELRKLDEKLRTNENLLEIKNLEVKKLTDEKREALVARYAAEATLRRVHANHKDEDYVPIEALIAPLEADIKMYKNEIAALREDNKALERITKSKESALVEAEGILRSALERALIVEEVQNLNMELKRQIEICLEENRILDKTYRQKVSEVEKLSVSVRELEESILAGAAAANAARDYQRQVSELTEEKKILERELARTKVLANRVATVVSNEWKNDDDKVMPVKQWLEERRFFQAEMQRIKEKLSMSERTAKAEAQLKEKFRLRLKTLEEGLKHQNVSSPHTTENSSPILGFLNSARLEKRSTSQPRGSAYTRKGSPLRQPTSAEGEIKRFKSFNTKYGGGEMPRKNLWTCRSKVLDSSEKENKESKGNSDSNMNERIDSDAGVAEERRTKSNPDAEGPVDSNTGDVVSGFLYDMLQKEVINLQKYCQEKDTTLNAKDEEIKVLTRKVDGLTKAMEIEFRRMKREAAAREKEVVLNKVDSNSKEKMKTTNISKR